MDPTNDPALRSFIPVAADSHFPIQNLPYGVFGDIDTPKSGVAVAIGDWLLDMTELERRGLLDVPGLRGQRVFDRPTLNPFLSLGPPACSQVRARISQLLRHDEATLRD